MKATACAIMFAALLHMPPNLWNEFTDFSKGAVAVIAIVMWCGFIIFLCNEES